MWISNINASCLGCGTGCSGRVREYRSISLSTVNIGLAKMISYRLIYLNHLTITLICVFIYIIHLEK